MLPPMPELRDTEQERANAFVVALLTVACIALVVLDLVLLVSGA